MRGPDAVVIGAGHNGLVAANILADAGWDVLVCEATGQVGGAVRSAQPITPGFTVDLFSAFYPLAAASPVLADLNLQDFGLQWSHPAAVLAHVFPDDRCAVLSRNRDVTANSVGQFAAGDSAAWTTLAEQWDQIGEDVVRALFRPSRRSAQRCTWPERSGWATPPGSRGRHSYRRVDSAMNGSRGTVRRC